MICVAILSALCHSISAPDLCVAFESTYHVDRGNSLDQCHAGVCHSLQE